MPSNSEHKYKSTHNEDFYKQIYLNVQNSIDWQIISLFYSALHLVDSYADKNLSYHPNSHVIRNRFIQRDHNLRNIYDDYMLLYNESKIVRYIDCSDCSSKINTLNNDLIPAFNNISSNLAVLI